MLLNERGQAEYHLHNLPSALAAFRQALALQPDNVEAHYYLGLCDRSSGDPLAAIRELEYVLQRDPDFAQTRFILGRLYLRANHPAQGERLMDEFRRAQAREHERSRAGLLLSTHPHSAGAHWRMALLYRQQGDMPHMTVELRKTLELAPRHAGAERLLRGQALVATAP